MTPALALLAAVGWQRTMAHRAIAGKVFAGMVVINIGIAFGIVLMVGGVTQTSRTQDIATVLACSATPEDTIYVSDAYPYDLPFYLQSHKPIVVLGDWPILRQTVGDGWQRELFEGADFDARAAGALQQPEVLAQAGLLPGNWYVARGNDPVAHGMAGWRLFYSGAGWKLYQSDGGSADSAAKGPEPAQHKGLPGCKDQRHK